MRIAIPLTAALLLGVAANIHPVFVGSAPPSRRSPRPVELKAPTPETPRLEESRETGPIQAPLDPGSKTPEPRAAPRKTPEPSWRKLFSGLTGELTLASLQQESVESVLRERQEEIRICHEEIRKSGLLDMRRYEWQVARMKESWYRRIDGLLDAAQHERFVALVEQGFFNEGLGFTEDPGMTVLD